MRSLAILVAWFLLLAPTPGPADEGEALPPPAQAQAQPAQPPSRPERWAPVTAWDYVSVGALGSGALAASLIGRDTPGSWNGGILFDDAFRSLLRIGSYPGRQAASTTSDVGRDLLIAAPFLLDSLSLSLLRDKDGAAAWRILVIDAQAMLAASFVTETAKSLVGRQRPYVQGCTSDSTYSAGCGTPDANLSFFSGHASASFTAASLLCLQHGGKLKLFGGGAADTWVCAGAMGVATVTSLLRIAADAHYATDVAVGAAVGLVAGGLLPTWLHATGGGAEAGHRLLLLPVGADALQLAEVVRF